MKRNLLSTEAERMARVITKSYSKAILAAVAAELNIPLAQDVDIFRSMILAGKAAHFDEAVMLVARHLDGGNHLPDISDEYLVNGKIERRTVPRATKPEIT